MKSNACKCSSDSLELMDGVRSNATDTSRCISRLKAIEQSNSLALRDDGPSVKGCYGIKYFIQN